MSTTKCETCKHWQPHTNPTTTSGNCHAHPPVVLRTSECSVGIDTYWPETYSDDWCSEHVYKMPAETTP